MTVKPETNFWKNLKTLLENGLEKYLVSRIESYSTPGFPDCVVFHKKTGFFTLELKLIHRNNRILISPLQTAWNKWYGGSGAPVFILVGGLEGRRVKLFSGSKAQELREKDIDSVPGLYEGSLKDLELWSVVHASSKK
tara:strand:- start:2612 stop:3025 length:414 start_codon:yes stop_codon:yes gene_type:complete